MWVATKAGHSCAFLLDGSVSCWGGNEFDQTDAPAGEYTATAVGTYHSCAIGVSGSISCWGARDYYRGDIDGWTQINVGQTDAPAGEFTAIAAGAAHSCAIGVSGSISCWGENEFGQTDAPDGEFVTITAGSRHSCAVGVDGDVTCWGNNSAGQVDWRIGEYVQVAAGGEFSCAIDADASISCWGDYSWGQTSAPAGEYVQIVSGAGYSCALGRDGSIKCWPDNSSGEDTGTDTEDDEYVRAGKTVYDQLYDDVEANLKGCFERDWDRFSDQEKHNTIQALMGKLPGRLGYNAIFPARNRGSLIDQIEVYCGQLTTYRGLIESVNPWFDSLAPLSGILQAVPVVGRAGKVIALLVTVYELWDTVSDLKDFYNIVEE